MKRILLRSFLLLLCLTGALALAEDLVVGSRHVRHYVKPSLPEIASRMNLRGSVKLQVNIAPTGKVTEVHPLGGHPVLVEAAVQAVKGWEFETSKESTSGTVTVVFD